MNTRLQVEHPVTEEAFGIDLVLLQLRVAGGEPLPEQMPEIPYAHAVEARVYAEDAENGFLPQIGRLLAWEEPSGPGIRVDSGVQAGDEVSVHYDPMLAKVIARGATREEARGRLAAALAETVALGVTTNLSYLRRVLDTEAVRRGEMDTSLLERLAVPPVPPPPEAVFEAARREFSLKVPEARRKGVSFPDPFEAGGFRVLR
jgi:acetyl/propionyl-CoA carboxylase alpha subunit